MKARVWHLGTGCCDHNVTQEQQIEIERARRVGEGARATQVVLDPKRLSEVFATPIVRVQAEGVSAFLSPG